MRVAVLSLGGEEVANLIAEPSWGLDEVLASIQEQRPMAPGARARLFHGGLSLAAGASLADIGVAAGSQLTLVTLPPVCILTASRDGTAKLRSAVSGE